MYRLYWRAGTAAFAPEALLEEMGEPYERILVDQRSGADTSPEFRALNPLGYVPVLVLPDATVITESAAIMIYLADLKPELDLAPAPDDPQRGTYLRWMVFLAAQLYQSYRHIYHADAYVEGEEHMAAVRSAGARNLEKDWQILEAALDPGPYLLGPRFSAVDIYCAMFPDWHRDRKGVLARHPRLARLCELVLSRPSVARVRPAHVA